MSEKRWDFDQYSWIVSYDKRMRDHKRLRYDDTLAEVAEKASVKKGDLVLDIGTGTGNLAVKFLERGYRVIGLDPSVKMLEIAARKVAEWGESFQIQLCEDPFLKIPFPENTFHVIASTYQFTI